MPSTLEIPARYTVAVRELCAFAAKQGDLDRRFTPSPTAQQGVAGHQTVAARRGGGYRSEMPLSGVYDCNGSSDDGEPDGQLEVRGRADGVDLAAARVDEVKTYKGDLDRMPANHRALHWAQAKVYGWLLCRQEALSAVTVALVYLEVGSQQETALVERCSAAELERFFAALCERFLVWARLQIAHRDRRDAGLQALRFVHGEFRPGQRLLAEQVFRAARLGRCLMAQAPTDIGKTIGTVFPMLKACADQRLDKVFYLTAKRSGRALARDALQAIGAAAAALPLRMVELVARETACVHPDKACHGDSCALARGFYDRLPAARSAAFASTDAAACGAGLDAAAIRTVALEHRICPYYLSQELVRWCDVVVADYNHYFDHGALLHGLAVANGWRVAVLVDEAHNLLDRARAMYSAALDQRQLRALRRAALATLKRHFDRLQRAWLAVHRDQTEPYRVLDAPPQRFVAALVDWSAAIAEQVIDAPASGGIDPALMTFYGDALRFARLAESFGAHSIFDATLHGASDRAGGVTSTLCIRNVVPAPFLKPRFTLSRSTVLFSATLAPQAFYADTLGLPADTAWLDVDAPFAADQLSVQLVSGVSTAYGRRAASLQPIADLMRRQFDAAPGNYLAFFSSYDYLDSVADAFEERHPGVAAWRQTPRMDDAARGRFLDRFAVDGQGIGFAVLGGAFGEGIDLPGRRLIGAFIATLGLPQFNAVNDEMRKRMDAAFAAGYDYTYLFPGLRKVVQAAGRVIRGADDRGCVYLIDDRFASPRVRALLPRWWRPGHRQVGDPPPPSFFPTIDPTAVVDPATAAPQDG